MDLPAPQPVFNPAAGQLEIPSSVTTQDPSWSSTHGGTTKLPSPEEMALFRKWQASQDASVDAMASPPPADMRTGEDVAADVQSQDRSKEARDRAEIRNMPDPFAPPVEVGQEMEPAGRELAPKTSEEFNASAEGGRGGFDPLTGQVDPGAAKQAQMVGGMRGPQTFEAAQDEANAYKAQQQAKINAETMRQQQLIEATRQQQMAAAQQRISDLSNQYSKAGNIKSFWEDQTVPQRLLRGIALGLGAMSPNGNVAADMIKSEMQNDLETKRMRANQALEKMKFAGATPMQITEQAKLMNEHLLAMQKTQLDTLDAKVQTMLAPFPQAQRQQMAATAAARAKLDADTAKHLADITGTTRESHVTNESAKTTTVDASGGDKGLRAMPTPDQVEQSARARLNAENADKLLEYEKTGDLPTGEQMSQIISNEHSIIAQNAKETHGGVASVKIGDVLRWVGVIPENDYPADMTDRQREAARIIMELGHALFAKRWTPGSISIPEAYQAGMSPIVPQRGDSQDQIKNKVHELVKYSKTVAEEMAKVAKPDVAERNYDARNRKPAAPKDKAEQQKALLALPKDERTWAAKARTMKRSDPSYDKAQSWLAQKGLR